MINFYPNQKDPKIEALKNSTSSEDKVKKLKNYLNAHENKTKEPKENESKNKHNYQKESYMKRRIDRSKLKKYEKNNGKVKKNPSNYTTLVTIQEEDKKYYNNNLTVVDI